MRATSIAIILDFLFIVPFIFIASSRHENLEPRHLILAGIFAFLSIAFRWYKNLGFDDRFWLALQVLSFVAVTNLFLPSSLSIDAFAQYIHVAIEAIYILLFYIILIIIGIYTTFWTPIGFVGRAGDPQEVRKDSLMLLLSIIAAATGIIFFPDFIAGWFIVTGMLWRSTVYYKRRSGQYLGD
jgi:hypothetical protein